MKKNYLAVTLLAGIISSMSAHANTGSISYTGSVAENSCVVSNMTQDADFGTIDKADLQPLAHAAIHSSKEMRINITACPASVAEVTLTPTYTAENASGPRIKFNGDMRGAGLWLVNGADDISMNSGSGISQTLVNNAAEFVIKPTLVRFTSGGISGAQDVIAGDFNATVDLALTYQ